MKGQTYLTSRGLGFFTVMLILTLDASNGLDLLDVLVPWIQAHTEFLLRS